MGGIVIGVNRNIYEVIDALPKKFTLIVIVRQRIGDWTQKIIVSYGPNFRNRRGTLWDEIREIGW